MNEKIFMCILIIVILILTGIEMYKSILFNKHKKKVVNKLLNLVVATKFDEFYEYIASDEVLEVIETYNINFLKLNIAQITENSKDFDSILAEFDNIKMTQKQKVELYLKAFSYYADIENKIKSRKYKNLILETSQDETQKIFVNRLYNIKIQKEAIYLDEIIEETNNLPEEKRGQNEYLISCMYHNLNDSQNEKKYMDLFKTHMNI